MANLANLFSRELLKLVEINDVDKVQSYVQSPTAIQGNLLSIAMAAYGQAFHEIYRMYINETNTAAYPGETLEVLQERIRRCMDETVDPENDFYCAMAHSIFASNSLEVSQIYVRDLHAILRGGYQEISFEDIPAARDTINDWVRRTVNMRARVVSQLINPPDPRADTRLLLVSSARILSTWSLPFLVRNTYVNRFYTDSETYRNVKFMRSCRMARVYIPGELRFRALELDFKKVEDKKVTMLLIEPFPYIGRDRAEKEKRNRNLIEDVIKEIYRPDISTTNKLTDIVSNMKYELVDVSLPKFELDSNFTQLREHCRRLDIREISKNRLSGKFGKILHSASKNSNMHSDLHVNGILHKAYIKVDEGETNQPGISSKTEQTPKLGDYPVKFEFNNPFLFLIRWDDLVVFHGVVRSGHCMEIVGPETLAPLKSPPVEDDLSSEGEESAEESTLKPDDDSPIRKPADQQANKPGNKSRDWSQTGAKPKDPKR